MRRHSNKCPHKETADRFSAIMEEGKYYDELWEVWACPWCGTDPPPTKAEILIADTIREEWYREY